MSLADSIIANFGVPSPGAVNDKLIAYFKTTKTGNGSPVGAVVGPGFYWDLTNYTLYTNPNADNTSWVVFGNGTYALLDRAQTRGDKLPPFTSLLDVTALQPSPRGVPLAITTYLGLTSSLVEPSVIYEPDGWGADSNAAAWKYWMVAGAYEGRNSANENPSIWVSNDGDAWVVPPGGTNPVVASRFGDGNNCDPGLFMSQDRSTLYFFYTVQSSAASDGIYYVSTTNGITWTAPTKLVAASDPNQMLSPRVQWYNGTYHLWTLNLVAGVPYVVNHRTATTIAGLATAADVACTGLAPVGAGNALWEFEVRRVAGEWWMLLTTRTGGASVLNTALCLATSANGTAWKQSGAILSASGLGADWDSQVYKATFVPYVDGNRVTIDIWYTGYNSVSYNTHFFTSSPTWVGRTKLTCNIGSQRAVSNPVAGATPALVSPLIAPRQVLKLTANATPTFPTPLPGVSFELLLIQDNTASRTVTWPTSVVWAADTAPTLSVTPGNADLIRFDCLGSSWWLGSVLATNLAFPIPGNYIARYDASAITGLADGAALTRWPDISPNGLDLYQNLAASAGSAPTYYSSTAGKTVNGLPAVWFSGAQWLYARALPAPLNGSTLVAVVKAADNSSTRQFADGNLFGSSAGHTSAAWFLNAGSSLVYTTAVDITNPHVLTMVFNGASSAVWLDGVKGVTGAGGSGTLDALIVGASRNANNFWNGPVCELILYNEVLTDTQIGILRTFLKAKWGTP